MSDDRIAHLEARIEELSEQQAELRKQLAQAQLDQWQGRIEDLEVQLHLGAMDAESRLGPLVEQLRNRWLDARDQVDSATTTASEVLDSLRNGLEQAMKDIREAVIGARNAASDEPGD